MMALLQVQAQMEQLGLGEAAVTALLDRLLHHNHILNIRGEIYRPREKGGVVRTCLA